MEQKIEILWEITSPIFTEMETINQCTTHIDIKTQTSNERNMSNILNLISALLLVVSLSIMISYSQRREQNRKHSNTQYAHNNYARNVFDITGKNE